MENGLPSHVPSGLFPAGPPRPTYREPHPVRLSSVIGGAAAAAAWMLLFGLLATTARAYVWLTVGAAVVAWAAAVGLARFGDRGVAVGIAISAGIGISIAWLLVLVRWTTSGWPLW